ncbi:MAG: adenosylcobinamide-phosphate synthase CbiB [Cyanobacteria bacterium J06649_4]
MRAAGRLHKARELALWFERWPILWFEWSLENGREVSGAILLLAATLDYVVGDPWGWPHPVQAMGKVINIYRHWAIARAFSPRVMKVAGVGLAFLVIGGTALVSGAGLTLIGRLSPALRFLAEVILLASCFAGRSLRAAAEDVLGTLRSALKNAASQSSDTTGEDGLSQARERLAMYVGRDTETLSAVEIRRAVLETVSENAIDGVLAPLFYAILGGLVGWAVPVALAYKAASTLDSMVGYREAPYTDLGWFSARLEDALTWLPCRLSVLTIALLSGRPGSVLSICWRDARADPSPNAGWSECVYAAALGVQLGGVNTYRGKQKVKPLLGDANREITADVIEEAFQITRLSFLVGMTAGIASFGLIH